MAGRKQRIVVPVASDEVRVRRSYFDCRHGQLHVRTAFSSSGGFDEHATVLCLHAAGLSSRVFRDFLPQMARDRSVYAPDLPGHGDSDPPAAPLSIGEYAEAIGDFLDQMRFRQVDVLGHQAGALVAAELAIVRPEAVRNLMLVSLPIGMSADASAPPLEPTKDGSHLAREWQRAVQSSGSSAPLPVVAEAFADWLYNGPNAAWLGEAARRYAASDRLPLVRQPAIVLRLRDEYWEATAHARSLLRGARVVELAEQGAALLRTAPEVVVRHAREFFTR